MFTIPQPPDVQAAVAVERGSMRRVELAARRELRSWAVAAEHLNHAGYTAAVPAELVRALQRMGLDVWPAGRRVA